MAEQVPVFARAQAKPGMESEVRAILEKNLSPTRVEKGCVFYRLFETNTPGLFYFFELWESLEDLKAHGKSSHIGAAREALEGKLEGSMEVSLAKEIP